MQLTIDRYGNISLPESVLKNYQLIPGSVLDIEESREAIILKPARREFPLKKKDGVLIYTGSAEISLEEFIKTQREKRFDQQSGINHENNV